MLKIPYYIIDLLNSTESNNIKVLNVDSQSVSMKNFLINLCFNRNVKQYEISYGKGKKEEFYPTCGIGDYLKLLSKE